MNNVIHNPDKTHINKGFTQYKEVNFNLLSFIIPMIFEVLLLQEKEMEKLQTLFDKYKVLVIVVLVLLVSGFSIYYHSAQNVKIDIEEEPVPESVPEFRVPAEEEPAESLNMEIFVDVKGAVQSPGIYKAVQSERVNDLIIRAGGFTDDAGEEHVNLARKVTDEMVIYVPKEGEYSEENYAGSLDDQSQERLLDINKASEEDFDGLPGIGPAKAKAIVDFRTENGPFKELDELKSVPGIGEATFDRLKETIIIN
ncbi:helix-hairpin-helix domain-containing protein [Bacillus salacetis]|uniref:helix-hairpin-helix domain-containing protein n=1 Tax=Bacillus salacetis TaxID=2315464 RepID=UPI0014443D4A|nr:helix-hairpin-helix domain-containing protein [Bacillus salacetis]